VDKAFAIVTGSSSGIGKELYENFKLLQGLDTWGICRHSAADVQLDLSGKDSDAVRILCDALKRNKRQVSILINNAGALRLDELFLNEKELLALIHLNLLTVYQLTNELYKEELLAPEANIINIASIAGFRVDKDIPLYCAVKAGVIAMTMAFAKRFAPEGIRVNSISPGIFKTKLVSGTTPPGLLQSIPLGREGETKELIPVVQMILDCKYMTGSNIVVDGGLSL